MKRRQNGPMIGLGITAVLVLAAAGCGSETIDPTAGAGEQAGPNCSAYEGKIRESSEFFAYEDQRTHPGDPVINPDGAAAAELPEHANIPEIAGQPFEWAVADPDGGTYLYYSSQDITKETKLSEFEASGGIALEVTSAEGYGVKDLAAQVGERAVPVMVGDTQGVVIWADPHDETGRRLHHVYWENAGHMYGLLIDKPAEQAVTVAREIGCA
jgi:hypothetical protein